MKKSFFMSRSTTARTPSNFFQARATRCRTFTDASRFYISRTAPSIARSAAKNFSPEKDDIVFTHKCAVHELIPAPEYNDLVLIIGQSYSDDFSGIFQKQTLPAHLSDRTFNRSLRRYFDALGEANKRSGAGAELVKKGFVDVIVGNLLGHYERVPASSTPRSAPS